MEFDDDAGAGSGIAPETQAEIFRTVFRFGNVHRELYGLLTLKADGRVALYDNPNERRFEFDGGKITFFGEDARPGLELPLYVNDGDFGFFAKDGHYLWPTFRLNARVCDSSKPKIIVNAPPRSGAHLCGRALELLGFASTQLVLFAQQLIDNRGLDPLQMRRETAARTLACGASAIAAIMTGGEFALAHIASTEEIARSRAEGALLLHCVRDLRDALASLWRFKHEIDEPSSPADRLWRDLPERDSFAAFLACHGEGDIRFLADCALALASENDPKLRFEEIASGSLNDSVRDELNALVPELGGAMAGALMASYREGTAAPQAAHASHRDLWSDVVQDFYQKSGLRAANRALGYDLP